MVLGLGYNAMLVMVGAGLLGIAAGVTGTFLFLRKRALVGDAIAHATLPGIGLAFLLMVALGGDGRNLAVLLIGAAVTAALGLLCVHWISTKTRLSEDTAIGAVLSVFFGFGVMLLTVIQNVPSGRQAGLDGLLLGATAGMLYADAVLIAVGGAVALAASLALSRPMTMVAFDAGFAGISGVNVVRIDLATMGLVLMVTVVGLKIVGLILIVALLIIPPVAARFWTDHAMRVAILAGTMGGVSGVVGAGLSATAPDLPTGPIIVLVAFAAFLISLIMAPDRGVLAAWFRHRRFERRVHLRQGLLALGQGQPIYERFTLRLLQKAGLVRADGVATDRGVGAALDALRDEARWAIMRADPGFDTLVNRHDGLSPIDTLLTADQIAEIDTRLNGATP
ncbi:metal ABC transporter permease [Actibacterium sp. 188UL27-1]|uniref:metal ABC transporter permease n=1 Tax=Actibacterium sp. 188UL27-1 TaxID=2786961 RepID=UPI00195DF53D|nr:metal ABC transporter permease [Actibacterium sp. 188UL27-1]MBM7068291.1 metal ABC transporter permease [Actibacterium sp. 188UL27-1]